MKKLNKSLKNMEANKGFTLVELIIVIAIIAILAAVLAPQYVKYLDKSRWSTDQNNANTLLNEVQVAIVAAQADDGTVANGTIVISSGEIAGPAADTDLGKALDAADPNWRSIKVTNKGTAAGAAAHKTYTITYTGTGATGAWA